MRRLLPPLVLAALVTAPLASAQSRSLLGDELGLLRITVGEEIAYAFVVDGEARTLTYATPRRGVVEARVTDRRGRELVGVVSSRRGAQARVNGERVRLREGQSLDDIEAADARSVWLLRQNYAGSECIGFGWLGEVAAELNGGEPAPSTQSILGVGGRLIGGILDIIGIGGGGGGGEGCSSSSTTCTEEDINGNVNTVTHNCACGVAMCSTQQFSVEVPVVVGQEDGSTEIRSEQRNYTRCLCGCLKLAENRR
ncbi:MAG: hypothetical protein AAF845_02525 [Bacteroidota bacterium]